LVGQGVRVPDTGVSTGGDAVLDETGVFEVVSVTLAGSVLGAGAVSDAITGMAVGVGVGVLDGPPSDNR
jgi:hypothetical protein